MLIPSVIVTKPRIFADCFEAPVINGCNRLSIISGWVSPHLIYQDLEKLTKQLAVQVDVTALHGMKIKYHDYSRLADLDARKIPYSGSVEVFVPCQKIGSQIKLNLTHEKIYVWLKDEEPICAFSGSANFTQRGIYDPAQNENLWEVDPLAAHQRSLDLFSTSSRIRSIPPKSIRQNKQKISGRQKPTNWPKANPPVSNDPRLSSLQFEDIPLFNTQDPNKARGISGINVGISTATRPRTDVDAAEINVGPSVISKGFFPSLGGSCRLERLSTGEIADATTVSQGGKNLRTTDNQVLGRWIRDYLGAGSNVLVDTRPSNLGNRSYFRVYKLASDYFILDL